jgi:membrane protease YdiL (CAAX protease family)
LAAWLFALAIALVYCAYARRLPSVRATLFAPSLLKFVAVLAAVAAALCEEGVFRKMLMNALNAHGVGIAVQIALSALAFGAVHSIWGLLKGSLRAALAAMAATGVLGLALAIVFASDGRNVWPCVIAHFIVTATIEPGLVLAALRGEMGGVAVAPATS